MRDGTYAEQLRSASELYKVKFRIISTLGAQVKTDILPSFSSFWRENRYCIIKWKTYKSRPISSCNLLLKSKSLRMK